MTDAPGDVIVMCREIDKETLDKIRMWRVNYRSDSKVSCKPPHSVIFEEGVFTF